MLISPEPLVTDYILRLIEHPGALQVLDFADGQVRLVAVKAYYGGPLVGQALRTLPEQMPGIEARVAAIYRQDRAIIPQGDTVIEADDEVFFIAARKHIRAVMGELRRLDKMVKRLIIAGGGNIGTRLAQGLEERFQVKVIERDPTTARRLSEQLSGPSCCTATPPTKTCCSRRTSSRSMSSAPSPTTTRPISSRPCSPSAWAPAR